MHDASPARFPTLGIASRDLDGPGPTSLVRIVHALDLGLLLVDAEARRLFANQSARRSLASGQSLVLEGDLVMPAARARRAGWKRMLARLQPGEGALFDLLDEAEGGPPRHAALSAMGPLTGDESGRAVLAIGIAPSPAAQEGRIDAYASHYRLTRAEARVLAHLTDDHDPGQIACSLGISVSTVRTHLKHILQKTGASSMRQLATRVLRMPVGFRCRH